MSEPALSPSIAYLSVATSGSGEHASSEIGLDPSASSRGDRDGGRADTATRSIARGPLLLLLALLVLLYHGIAVKLVRDWYELPDFSHGFLIPFFAAFLLWDKRHELGRTAIAPTWAGISLVVLGLCELLLGMLGADLFLQRTSFVLLAAGLVWALLGKAMLGRVKFVLFVLLLAIPLPTTLFNQISFPLQLLASRFASDLLQLARVPVLQACTIIHLPAMPLEVAEACSGIRSLMSLFTVAVIYGYFLERKKIGRAHV